jgi:hypothetical protein
MEWSEIIISIRDNKPHQIAFIKDCIMEFVEPFEVKHHYRYFKLDITTFKFIL